MTTTSQTVTLRGKANYAKILESQLSPNYNKDGFEWKMDLIISKETAKELKAYGIADRVKSKDDYVDGRPYLSFKHKELQASGKKNDPISIVDIKGRPWDQKVEIGNESDVDVKFSVVDFGPGKKKGVYIRSVRVLNLVPYTRQGFDPISEDDPFFKNLEDADGDAATAESQDALADLLDDDVEDIV